MRPIGFRAWDKDNKMKKYMPQTNHPQMFEPDGISFSRGEVFFDIYQFKFDEIKLMQFTGLLDKNGKKIFEADCAKNQFGEVGQIVFTNGAFWLKYIKPYDWDPMCPAELLDKGNQFEVIGNIYENPELLKEQ